MSIGGVYCWTMWSKPLTTLSGVVASSPSDFTVSQVLPVFSVAALGLGLAGAGLGKWVERVGPLEAASAGSKLWLAGLLTCGAAAKLKSLPLLYVGYGCLGGAAWGMLYLAPVSAVMKWFPDKRGLATGITLSAFGAGAAIAPPIIDAFASFFFVAPQYLGAVSDVALTTLGTGAQVLTSDPSVQVVVASASDAARVGLKAGVYADGTGDSGAAGAFASLAFLYGGVGAAASRYLRSPPEGWVPDGFVVDQNTTAGTDIGLPVELVLKTKQFPLLWMTVFGNAIGGLALISSSKMIMVDIWSNAMPDIVTASFATGYVAALGSANSIGRLGWAVGSDKLGRKNVYTIFGLGIPIVAGVPFLIDAAAQGNAGALPLWVFVGGSTFAIANYGGIFSVLPAYIADLYGQKHASAIHGAALTAWSASAVAGPMGLAALRSVSERSAIEELMGTIDDGTFERAFGAAKDAKVALIESKTLTISRLMDIVPEGVPDPTPHLYDTTFYVAAGFLGVAAICNRLLTPPDVVAILKQHEKEKAAVDSIKK